VPAFSASGAVSGGSPTQAAHNTQCLANMIAAGAREVCVDGDYAMLPYTVPDVFSFYSENSTGAVLITTVTNANFITAGISFTARNIKFSSVAKMTGGAMIYSAKNGTTVDRCEFTNFHCAVRVSGNMVGGNNLRVGASIVHCRAREPSISGSAGFIDLDGVSSATVAHNIAAGPEAGNQPWYGFRVRQCDTVDSCHNNITLMGLALLVDPDAGESTIALMSERDKFDSGQYQSAMIWPKSGGRVVNSGFSSWFGLARAGDGLLANATEGEIGAIDLTGSTFCENFENGLHAHGPIKGLIAGSLIASGNKEAHINMTGGVSNWTLVGQADNLDARGAAKYGLNVGAGSAGYYALGRFRGTVSNVVNGGTGQVINH
jgi:hypothetical protein